MTRRVVGRKFSVGASAAFTGNDGGSFHSVAVGGSRVRSAHAWIAATIRSPVHQAGDSGP
jgi:hypothetical protein